MRKFFITLLVILLYFSGFAQDDWLYVHPNKKVYFEDSRKVVYCIRIFDIRH